MIEIWPAVGSRITYIYDNTTIWKTGKVCLINEKINDRHTSFEIMLIFSRTDMDKVPALPDSNFRSKWTMSKLAATCKVSVYIWWLHFKFQNVTKTIPKYWQLPKDKISYRTILANISNSINNQGSNFPLIRPLSKWNRNIFPWHKVK